MAERLAAVAAPPLVSSRPERPRGRVRRLLRRLVAALLVLLVAAAGALFTAHFLSVQRSAAQLRPTALIPPEMPARALVVIAHPGQEVLMAGTLAELDRAGAQVDLLSMTRGESQPPGLAQAATPEQLAGVRADELAASADALGVDSVHAVELADGSLVAADPAAVAGPIGAAIDKDKPSIILTVSDPSGTDTDTTAVAAYVQAAAAEAGSGVARVWTVTRGDREASWTARLAGRPEPPAHLEAQVAVRIQDVGPAKQHALLAHGSQSPDLVAATYPYADRLPAWVSFRFWDREYFALASGQPLP